MTSRKKDDLDKKRRKARKMFNKWIKKVELSLRKTNSADLGQNSKLLLDWSKKIELLDPSYYLAEQSGLRELLQRSARKLDFKANKKLDLVLKHKKGTAIRTKKFISAAYFIKTYLFPVAKNADIKLNRTRSHLLIKNLLKEMERVVEKIDEEQTRTILTLIFEIIESGGSFSKRLVRTFQNALIGKIASKQIQEALEKGEGQRVEFKSQYPDNVNELAKVIASFATSEGGMVFLGVNNEGDVIGLNSQKLSVDELSNRISNLVRIAIDPSLNIQIGFWEIQSKTFSVIEVPKGPEPVYFVNGIPYVRILTSSCKASAYQVKELHRHYFQKTKDF